MSRTVTALYDAREEAVRALDVLRAEVPVRHAHLYDRSPDSLEALKSLDLSREEHTACRVKLASGGYMLLAQVGDEEDPNRVVSVLERVAEEDVRAPTPVQFAACPEAEAPIAAVPAPTIEQERAPASNEELRVGARDLVRGGTRVRTRVEDVPVIGEIELIEELVRVETRPAGRLVSSQELEQAGLLRDRVIEISQIREEPVISKQAFVREEVVVTKASERRLEQFQETVRRTAVEKDEASSGADSEEMARP